MLSVFLFFNPNLNAQTFQAGLVGGINFSELEGDEITDYFGINVGILGKIRLSKKWLIGTEILFSQNGEYILPDFYPNINYGKTQLNHIEVPVYSEWQIGVFEKEKYLDWHIQTGFAFVKLLNFHIEDDLGNEVNDQIKYGKEIGWAFQVGTSWFFAENWGIQFRVSKPFETELDATLTFRMVYLI